MVPVEREPLPFDIQTVKIDLEATRAFYQEKEGKERGSNPIKIGFDEQGHKVLLKTSIFFKDTPAGSNANAEVSYQGLVGYHAETKMTEPLEEAYERIRQGLLGEQRASNLGHYLGVHMPYAQVVQIDQVPYVVSNYIEGAEDKEYGQTVDLSSHPEQLTRQELQLALAALLKVFFNVHDDGQFLQTAGGEIFLSDIRATASARSIDMSRMREYLKRSQAIILANENVLQHQLQGMQQPEFADALTRLEQFNQETLTQLVCENPDEPAPIELRLITTLLSRIEVTSQLFRALSNDQEVALKFLIDVKNSK